MASREIVSTEPATGAVLWRRPIGDLDVEVEAARSGWTQWAARSLVNRVETLRRFANVMRAKADAFTDLLARETGKPLWEARNEIEGVIGCVDVSVSAYSERSAQRRLDAPMNTRVALRHKPHGVLGIITPYTDPVLITASHAIPALLAGNAVILKPSEHTPASVSMLADCLLAAGVPESNVRFLAGGPEQGKALVTHPGVDGILFTGSTRTGIAINRTFADRPERVLALEMGGNNPVLVWDTPDLYTAAVLVIQSAFASSGQRCTAARRLIVDQKLYEPLVDLLTKLIGRLIVAEPHADPAPFMGPVIDNNTADMLTESFLALMMRGGRAIRHLERPIDGRPFLLPGLIDVTDMGERPDIELFGPILQLIRVATFEEAIVEANNTRYGLVASLITQNPKLYDQFWANARAGMVNWNRPTHSVSAGAPFGGVGWSGNHRPSAYYAADYCAYPVVSQEADQARAAIGIGLRDG